MIIKRLFDNKIAKYIFFTVLGIGIVFLIWYLISVNTYKTLFPDPLSVISRFGELFIIGSTYEAIGGTLLRLFISILISFLLALILGIFGGLNESVYRTLNPLVIVLRTLPVVAIIFIIIVLLKPTYALFIITSLTMFPLMYEAVVSGIRGIDPNIMDSLRLETSKYHPYALFRIIIPCAKDNIILGLIQSLGLGMKVSLMAETLVGTNTIKGLGRMIYQSYLDLDMINVFAVALYAVILIGLIDIIVHILKKHFQ